MNSFTILTSERVFHDEILVTDGDYVDYPNQVVGCTPNYDGKEILLRKRWEEAKRQYKAAHNLFNEHYIPSQPCPDILRMEERRRRAVVELKRKGRSQLKMELKKTPSIKPPRVWEIWLENYRGDSTST